MRTSNHMHWVYWNALCLNDADDLRIIWPVVKYLGMLFTKMHGAGNDYVLMDARGIEADWNGLAKTVCDRHLGIGADGLLLVFESEIADARMQMFNPDGSEAEMCGNGIRCFVKYVLDQNLIFTSDGSLKIETRSGVLDVMSFKDSLGRISKARVAMGRPIFDAVSIPVSLPSGENGLQADIIGSLLDANIDVSSIVAGYPVNVDGHTFSLTCVSMGNPHAVAFIEDDVDQIPLALVGPLVENHPIFPNKVNFHVVNIDTRDKIKVRSWERGAGMTLACGTGACAVQAAARLLGFTDSNVAVHMPGGVLDIDWDRDGMIYMGGPVVEVFKGEWGNEMRNNS